MKRRIKSICKGNEYIDNREGTFKIRKHNHLVIGKLYEFTIDDNGYNLLVNGEERVGSGYIFFKELPIFYEYDYKLFFMTKEEMRDTNIDNIIK